MDKQIIKEYENALFWAQNGDSRILDLFVCEHPTEYRLISAMYRKRVAINDTLLALGYLNRPVYWFTLTFNNDRDALLVETKRKYAQTFLSNISIAYLMVEEYGEDNGRYHIHGFLIFNKDNDFRSFVKWPSRQKIQELTPNLYKKKVRYLTKYAVKSVPRLRRSKVASLLYTEYLKHKKVRYSFPCILNEFMNKYVDTVISSFYNVGATKDNH